MAAADMHWNEVVRKAAELYINGGGGGGSLSAKATAAAPTYTEGQNAPLSMDLSGGLRVTGSFSASTAGTATAAAPTYVEGATNAPLSFNLTGDQRVIAKQSGTWNIGSITTLPALAAGSNTIGSISNISGTISLPTGAATAANQTSVIGTKAAGTAAASAILTGGVFNTALPTLTNGQQAALQFDSSARLYVNVGAPLPAGSNAIGSITNTGFTATGTVAHDAADSGNPIKIGGKAYSGAPAAVADGDRVDQAMTVRGAAHTVVARPDGTVVDPDAPAETYLTVSTPYFNGNVGSTKYLVATGAQVLTDYFIENPDATNKAYVQFFNAASTAAVTLGTTAPVRSIGLAAGEKANVAGLALEFPLGLVIAGTTTATGSTTAVTGLVVNLGYKAG